MKRRKITKPAIWQVVLFLVILIADRITKDLAPNLPREGTVLLPGLLGLRYTENLGMAFSLFSGKPFLLGVLSLAVIIAVILYVRKKEFAPLPLTALLMMFAGAAGNMVDRFFTGYVPDMIEFLFVDFAIFNIADAALTIGCVLLIFSLLFRKKDWEEADKKT